jgi:hypothetical protein
VAGDYLLRGVNANLPRDSLSEFKLTPRPGGPACGKADADMFSPPGVDSTPSRAAPTPAHCMCAFTPPLAPAGGVPGTARYSLQCVGSADLIRERGQCEPGAPAEHKLFIDGAPRAYH